MTSLDMRSAIRLLVLALALLIAPLNSFTVRKQLEKTSRRNPVQRLFNSFDDATVEDTVSPSAVMELKADLVQLCSQSPKPSVNEVRFLVDQLQAVASSMPSPEKLSGTWELLYSPEDPTRSSPFFWAFRKAFPDNADQIFGITDSIPAPLKEIGPATQDIDIRAGTFVSRVKVATLGGMATSIMTTRASIVGIEGAADLKIQIDTTKPEESTAVKTLLGPLGDFINENAPAFPSGAALERAMPGSSQIVMQTMYLDDGLRVSQNPDRPGTDIFVWRRTAFRSESL